MLELLNEALSGQTLYRGDVYLRAPQRGDYVQWALLRERSRNFLRPWEPSWGEDALSLSTYKSRLKTCAKQMRSGYMAPYFVFRCADDTLVGEVILSNIKRGNAQSANLGYWVGEAHTRRGYSYAATSAVLSYAYDWLALERVEAACMPTNLPSLALLAKLGFRREGCARNMLRINGKREDHLIFALLQEDFQTLQRNDIG